MVIIGKPVNGITINGNEYVMDEYGNEMRFHNEIGARNFLYDHGMTDQDISDALIQFIEV